MKMLNLKNTTFVASGGLILSLLGTAVLEQCKETKAPNETAEVSTELKGLRDETHQKVEDTLDSSPQSE